MRRFGLLLIIFFFPLTVFSADKVLNIYTWTGEIPDFTIRQFEKETGIKVNVTIYGSNEMMYAKLRATKKPGYDIIMPSSYFVDRMSHQNMLEPLDKSKLPNWKNINPHFLSAEYDPQSTYSVPYIWGTTGIAFNRHYHKEKQLKKWSALWSSEYQNQIMLLDDTREVFSMALLTLGYSINDPSPTHLHEAFLKLKQLMKNVKLFSTETIISVLIDEDATLGMSWNGDAYKAYNENSAIDFSLPEEGFVIWVDTFAIPKSAPHKEAAHAFINFMLDAKVVKAATLSTNYPTANLAAQNLLPKHIRNNLIIYPSPESLKKGQFQTDIGEEALTLMEKYWEELKVSG